MTTDYTDFTHRECSGAVETKKRNRSYRCGDGAASAKRLTFPANCRTSALMLATTKTERLEARVPVFLKRMVQRAADLQGRSITDFVISTLDKSARETVREHEVMKLNARDSLKLAKALIDPPPPNAALRKAMARHRKMVTMR